MFSNERVQYVLRAATPFEHLTRHASITVEGCDDGWCSGIPIVRGLPAEQYVRSVALYELAEFVNRMDYAWLQVASIARERLALSARIIQAAMLDGQPPRG